VREKLLNRHSLGVFVLDFRNEFSDGVVQSKLPALDENHYARRCRNRLRQTRHVENRINRHFLNRRNK
jgi:hypothetical protein